MKTLAEIHLFYGLGGSYSSAIRAPMDSLEKIIDDLPSKADAQTHPWNDWKPVAYEIIERQEGRKKPVPTILIGHSQGVKAAANAAYVLQKHGLPVDYLGAISPTLDDIPPLPANVREIGEFLELFSLIALGRLLGGGRVESDTVTPDVHKRLSGGHIGLPENDTVRRVILSNVAELIT